MASCDINTLLASGKKFTQLGGALNPIARLALLKNILLALDPAADVSINTLLSRGKCFSCLTAGQQQIVKLQLLCEISEGSGGGGGVFPFDNLVLWLKPETLDALYVNLDPAPLWPDSSPAGNDADGNASGIPVNYRSNEINGHGCVRVSTDEEARFLSTGSLFSGSQPRTVFVVYKIGVDGNTLDFAPGSVWSQGVGIPDFHLFELDADSTNNPLINFGTTQLTGPLADTENTAYCDSCRYDGTTVSTQRNGVAQSSGPFALNTDVAAFFIGTSAGGPGNLVFGSILEVMVWQAALTPTQMAEVNNYLLTKYSL